MHKILTTDRLLLTLLEPGDWRFMAELVNSPGWLTYVGDRNVHSQEEAEAYVGRIIDTPDLMYWVVRLKTTSVPIGVISFIKRTYLDHFDIGFAFLPAYMGHGYAYEAARHVMTTVRQLPEQVTLLATTLPDNANSIRLLKKLGFLFREAIRPSDETLHVYASHG